MSTLHHTYWSKHNKQSWHHTLYRGEHSFQKLSLNGVKWFYIILWSSFLCLIANGFSSIVFNGDRYPMPRCRQNQQSTYTWVTNFPVHSPNCSASEGSICSQGEHLTAWWVNNLELGRRNTTIVAWLEGVHTSECGSGHMVRLASPAGMSCPVCMVAACTRV